MASAINANVKENVQIDLTIILTIICFLVLLEIMRILGKSYILESDAKKEKLEPLHFFQDSKG